MADRSDYPAFVAACWTRLLRTAYLLVQDWAAAEDLTQAALVKAWLAWPRLDDDPEAYVRKIIVTHARVVVAAPLAAPGDDDGPAAGTAERRDRDRDRGRGRARRRVAGAGAPARGPARRRGAAAVAGVASGVILAHEPAPGHAASYSGPPLPASFTASDGAAYRRLAMTPVTGPARRSAGLTVTAGSNPIDVMASCDHPTGGRFILVEVNGSPVGTITCQGPSRLTGLFVHPGERARITFETGLPHGSLEDGWQFAAYAWTPPATARPAPAEPRPPHSFTGPAAIPGHGNVLWRLVASRSGTGPPTALSPSRRPPTPATSSSAWSAPAPSRGGPR